MVAAKNVFSNNKVELRKNFDTWKCIVYTFLNKHSILPMLISDTQVLHKMFGQKQLFLDNDMAIMAFVSQTALHAVYCFKWNFKNKLKLSW